MAQRAPDEVPPFADLLGGLGILVALAGALLVGVRLAMLAWQAWGWWSGLAFIAAGLGLFLLAAVGAWLYTTAIPALRVRWYDIKYEVRRRREQRRQAQQQAEAEGEADD